ncbi:MAG: hypothetical protein J7L15_05745 [Clostridiales bacterium]|nr:hypothetical protein [Clostridiales bacterium]
MNTVMIQIGKYYKFENYLPGVKGNIKELGIEVMQVTETSEKYITGIYNTRFAYISRNRIIDEVSKEDNPEYFL